MTTNHYPPPVDRLLTLGDPQHLDTPVERPPLPAAVERSLADEKHVPMPFLSARWPDYRLYGLGPEHVPDLLRLMADEELLHDENDANAAVWGPLHAWRALGQLRAAEATEPLISLFATLDALDYFQMEVPDVLGLIGPPALPMLTAYLQNTGHAIGPRITAAGSLSVLGRMHPELRDACIAALIQPIEASRTAAATVTDDDLDDLREFNGFLLVDLMDLEATETLPVIRQAMAAGLIDESVAGDREDIEIGFGVREQRDTPRPRYQPLGLLPPDLDFDPYLPDSGGGNATAAAKKAKRKQKIAKQSKRVNRKKR